MTTLESPPEFAAQLPADGELGVVHIGALTLENGIVLDDVSIAVQRWGELSPNRDNVVVVLQYTKDDEKIIEQHVLGIVATEDGKPLINTDTRQ